MENKNYSPLDEIMKLTADAKNGKPQEKPVAVQSSTQRQSQPQNRQSVHTEQPRRVPTQRPVSKPAPAPGPVSAPSNAANNQTRVIPKAPKPVEQPKEDLGIDVPEFANNRSKIAEQERQKRERARKRLEQYRPEDRNKTRVIDYSELGGGMSPDEHIHENATTDEFDNLTAQRRTRREVPKKTSSDSYRKNPEKEDAFEEKVGKGVISSSLKAVIYIVSVLVVSICLSLFIIFVGNDCFAFVKNDVETVVTIPENAELSDIADILSDNDVIKYPAMFKLYINIRDKDYGKYITGEHTVNSNMSYDKLIDEFLPYASRQEITVTFVEGSTTDEIIDLLVEKGIGTRERYVEVINNYDYDLWFVKQLNPDKVASRKYRLDGYLFPDTYNFFSDSKEEDVIYKFLSNFNNKFSEENIAYCEELGMTPDEIVTLASMIQKEAKYVTDYPYTSSVFHNRLNSNVTNGKLESNATVQYTMPKEEVETKLTTDQIEKYDTPYNTFLYEGLPVGPICNASLNAINFALYPEDTNYYYFVSDKQGYNLYASNYKQHLNNVASVEEEQ